jgi:hypothetical protein
MRTGMVNQEHITLNCCMKFVYNILHQRGCFVFYFKARLWAYSIVYLILILTST